MTNNTLKSLESKISNLEQKIKKLEKQSLEIVENLGFSVWTQNLLNINIINRKQFVVKTIENNSRNHLFFQLKVSFLNYSTQDIKFDLLCDNILIASDSNHYQNNISEITLFGTYQNIISDKIKVELSTKPLSGKQITILSTTLTVWGISTTQNEEYDALETSYKYLLSYISNNRLYYKIFDKQTNSNDVDFIYLNEAKSHSITKDSADNIYIFRVDCNGNLFFRKSLNSQENFISNNVSKVSSCCFNNKIYFSYISSGDCYYGEIFNNFVISNKKITTIFGIFESSYMYANETYNKCYMILTKKDNSNYLLENISNNLCSSENIYAEINLNISTEVGTS